MVDVVTGDRDSCSTMEALVHVVLGVGVIIVPGTWGYML